MPRRESHRCCPTTLLTSRVARTGEELRLAQQIRYAAYASAGWIDPHPSERFSDAFDDAPNSASHLLRCRGATVGTMRTTVYRGLPGWDDVPSLHAFGHRVFEHFGSGPFVEMTRFALRPEFHEMKRHALLALLNNAVHAADVHQCRYMLAAVRESHIGFYQRMEFNPVEAARPYPGLKFKTVLMRMDWLESRRRLAEHPVFHLVFKFPREDCSFEDRNAALLQAAHVVGALAR